MHLYTCWRCDTFFKFKYKKYSNKKLCPKCRDETIKKMVEHTKEYWRLKKQK